MDAPQEKCDQVDMLRRASLLTIVVFSATTSSLASAQTDAGDAAPGDASTTPDAAGPVNPPDAAFTPDAAVPSPDASAPPNLGSCNISSGYSGDNACLLPPPDGFQLHYGPSDYNDPAAVAPFLLEPLGEGDACVFMKTPNAVPVQIDTFQFRSRPGLVAASIWLLSEARADSAGPEPCATALDASATLLFATDRTQATVELAAAPENAGLAWEIPAGAQVAFRARYINAGSSSVALQEAWLNALAASATATENLVPIELRGRGSVPATTNGTLTFRCDAAAEVRIVQLAGAMTESMTELTAFTVAADGTRTLIYGSRNWSETPLLSYDSITVNPAPAPGLAGGASGIVTLNAGEAIEWECEVENAADETLSLDPTATGARGQCDLLGAAVATGPFTCTSTGGLVDAGALGGGGEAGSGGAGGSPPAMPTTTTGGAVGAGASTSTDAGTDDAPAGSDDDGCSCRIEEHGAHGSRAYGLLAALGVAAVAMRRVRRSARS